MINSPIPSLNLNFSILRLIQAICLILTRTKVKHQVRANALLNIYLKDLSLGFYLPYIIGLFFTTFALVGVSNAINIIDGLAIGAFLG
nr:hypothetical protein [Helicobacter sp.]